MDTADGTVNSVLNNADDEESPLLILHKDYKSSLTKAKQATETEALNVFTRMGIMLSRLIKSCCHYRCSRHCCPSSQGTVVERLKNHFQNPFQKCMTLCKSNIARPLFPWKPILQVLLVFSVTAQVSS